jgi:hypothetical protein
MRRFCAMLLVVALSSGQSLFAQAPKESTGKAKSTGSSDLARINELTNAISALTKIEGDPQFTPGPDIKNALDEQIHDMTCEKNELQMKTSLSGSEGLKNAVAKKYYDACLQAPAKAPANNVPGPTANAKTVSPPPQVAVPAGCSALGDLQKRFNLEFNNRQDAVNEPLLPTHPISTEDRSKQYRLNANSSGGEVNTKSVVYLGYVTRLRYSATLGGTVTTINTPSIPSNIFPSIPTPSTPAKPSTSGSTKAPEAPGAPGAPEAVVSENPFDQFNKCLVQTQTQVAGFQGTIMEEEIALNSYRNSILNYLNGLQPIVGTIGEASSVNLGVLPRYVVPPFPIGSLVETREVLAEFIEQYPQFKSWAHQSPENGDLFDANTSAANQLAAILDRYTGAPQTSSTSKPGTSAPSAPAPGGIPGAGAPQGQGNGSDQNNPSSGGTNTPSACSAPSVGSKEVSDYEQNRCFVESWRNQFKTVAGEAKAPDVDYFIVDYKPLCGGFFGQGTSTQMQLTVFDALSPSQKPSPTNLDKIVCQPALSVSSGLGLSFVPDKTPAFVAGTEKSPQGNPVLDSNGNPVIIQTLGYSNQASVRPGYALQVNASLLSTRQSGIELHWSVGSMLTAASGGVTTDIITGPTISLHKRAVFISPMYDLGLRTTYLSGFTVGMPQGNLTSPPTHQVWKSGFGLTITFPFSTNTNNTQSSNTSGKTDNSGGNPKQ